MLEAVLEVASGLLICAVLAYFMLLSAPPQEDPAGSPADGGGGAADGEGSSKRRARSWQGRLRAAAERWLPLEAGGVEHPLRPAYRALVALLFGREALEDSAENTLHQRAAAAARRRGVAGRVASDDGRHRASESAAWVNQLVRWVAMLALGGGTALTEVWADRVRYGAVKAVVRANQAWEEQQRRRRGDSAGGGRGRTLLRLQRLELGPGFGAAPGRASSPPGASASDDGGGPDALDVRDGGGPEERHARSASAGDGGAAHAGPPVGVALPRVSGAVDSAELPGFGGAGVPPAGTAGGRPPASAGGDAAAAGGGGGGGGGAAPLGRLRPSHLGSSADGAAASPPGTTLRCFHLPLHYEDGRFYLRLHCCLPLLLFLPPTLAIPSDVLSLECAVTVRRVTFHGTLYAAFIGSRVELCFPRAPHFTAQVEVTAPDTPPAVSGGGGFPVSARRDANLPPPHQPQQSQQQRRQSVFTATSTAHNASVPRGGGGFINTSSAASTCVSDKNAKVQELVLMAVRNGISALVYPAVVEGTMVAPPFGAPPTEGGGGAMKWARRQASLPLY